jgi:hypothetical protein
MASSKLLVEVALISEILAMVMVDLLSVDGREKGKGWNWIFSFPVFIIQLINALPFTGDYLPTRNQSKCPTRFMVFSSVVPGGTAGEGMCHVAGSEEVIYTQETEKKRRKKCKNGSI